MSEKTWRWDDERFVLLDPEGEPYSGYAVAPVLNALTSERDEAVRVAGELRAKAESLLSVLDRCPLFASEGYDAGDVLSYMVELRDALTQGGDLPLKENEG